MPSTPCSTRPTASSSSTPGYDGFDPDKGGVSTYPPGAKENGGIFLHANPWVMIAETLLRNGDRAYQYYRQINPAARNDAIEAFECEPYVYPQNILGDEHPQFGLARNAWLTGTASWCYQAATQYILGIRPRYDWAGDCALYSGRLARLCRHCAASATQPTASLSRILMA